jgi:beta propeller repeat protein
MTRLATAARTLVRGRFIVILTFAVACLAPAPAAQARPAAPAVFPVCIEMGGQAGPDIAGTVVVWTDNRNGELDIYGRDLNRSGDFTVCTAAGSQDNPAVAAVTTGSRTEYVAVWVDKRNHDGGDIYGRDLTTRKSFVVARSATLKWFPEICDSWVAWIEAADSAGPYTIRARDLAVGKTYKIATSTVLSSFGVTRRTLDGVTVYTAVYASSGGDISGRDLPDGAPFNVSRSAAFEWSPDISANRVVWWEDGERVWLRNLKTGRRTLVGTGSRPRVDGELVVWDDGGQGGGFVTEYKDGAVISVRNVAHGTKVLKISQPHLTCLFPAVSGDTVVWESGPARRVLLHIHVYGAHVH